ncbi:MAG: TRAP transporter large permease subunit [Ignavibacteria bacterium]|nr:MAG: TRAP transporter large permease subunit [Ignavibacteria bacterium]
MPELILAGILLLILSLAGTPLFAIVAAIGLLAFHAAGIDTAALIIELNRLADFPALIAIPLFTFAGQVLAESKAPQRLMNLVQAIFGWLPGGMAVVAICTTAVFTAFTGASGVTIIALGGLLYPSLLRQGYPENFSLGLMTTSGSLGLLFPPSLPIILYALVAKVSLDTLFLAGLLPGILLVVVLSAYSIRVGIHSKVERIPLLPLPILVIGGIYGGVFTAAEAAAVTAFYALIVEVFIRRDLKLFGDIGRIVRESMMLVGAILIMLGAALGLTNYLIDQEIPNALFNLISQYVDNKIVFLLILNAILLGINMFEVFSAIIIIVPIIIPIAMKYDVNPIHLGIMFLMNLEIGYMIPPLALNLFLASSTFKKPLPKIYRAVFPFLLLLLAVLLLITYVPDVSLVLTRLMGSPL